MVEPEVIEEAQVEPVRADYITKGSRVRARWLEANTEPHSLAGVQLKLEATQREVSGTVRHVWGDHPVNPVKVTLGVEPDVLDSSYKTCPKCGTPHVEIDADWVVEVLARDL